MSLLLFFMAGSGSGGASTPPPDPVPDELTTFTVAPLSASAMDLSWPAVQGATYEIETSLDGTTWEALTTTTALSYTHSGLTADTRHYYRFRVSGGPWAYRFEYTLPATPAPVQMAAAYGAVSGASAGEQAAHNAVAQKGQTDGWWKYLICFYPYVGASLAQKMYNLTDPVDLNDAFRQTILEAVVDDAKGVLLTTANVNTLNTFVNPYYISSTPLFGSSYYVQGPTHWLVRNNDTPYQIVHWATDGYSYPSVGIKSAGTPFSGTPQAGGWFVQRKSLQTVDVYNNGVLVATDNKEYIKETIELDITFEASPLITFRPYVSHGNTVLSCYAHHHAMPDSVAAAYQTAVAQLMTDLNRQVAV